MSAPHRVTATKVEYRTSGVLSSAYYGEVINLEAGDARRLVSEGAVEPVSTGR